MQMEEMPGYSYADWSADSENRRSKSANTFLTFDGAIRLRKKQPSVTLLTAESAYSNTGVCVVMTDMKIDSKGPSAINEGNRKTAMLRKRVPGSAKRTMSKSLALLNYFKKPLPLTQVVLKL